MLLYIAIVIYVIKFLFFVNWFLIYIYILDTNIPIVTWAEPFESSLLDSTELLVCHCKILVSIGDCPVDEQCVVFNKLLNNDIDFCFIYTRAYQSHVVYSLCL